MQRHLLVIVATTALRGAAAPGQFDDEVDSQALAEAMAGAYLQAKASTGVGEKFGYQLGASAAVMLVRDATRIFGARMPEPGPPLSAFAYRGYPAGAAFSLALAVTEAFADVILPVWSQPESREHFLDMISEIIADPAYPPRSAVTALVNCLREFREADQQLAPGVPGPAVAPVPRPAPRTIPWRPIGIATGATAAVLALLAWTVPAIPRAFTGTGTMAGQSPTGNIPLPSQAPTTVSLAQRLPNTRVQLFAFVDAQTPAREAQTAPGILPAVAPAVLRINGTAPTVLTDSHLMDNGHPGDPEPHLDAGDFIPVHPIDRGGAPTVYRFVLSAPPDRTTVGYWCGYTPKPVQILVTTSDNASAATTTYPVYVLRDKDC